MRGWEDWLYENHGRDQIAGWVANLNYFSFERGAGGLVSHGEAFRADIRYVDRADLIAKLRGLGVELAPMRPDAPRPEPEVAYTAAEWARFPRAMRQFPDLEEPQSQTVEGHRVHLFVHDHHFEITVSGSDPERWAVTKDDAHACSEIDRRLDDLGWRKWRTFDHLNPQLTVRGAGTYQP